MVAVKRITAGTFELQPSECHSLGIRSYSRKACTIGTETHALIVRDLLVDTQKQECEEVKRCPHLSCPLNRTTKASDVKSKKDEGGQKFANRHFGKMKSISM